MYVGQLPEPLFFALPLFFGCCVMLFCISSKQSLRSWNTIRLSQVLTSSSSSILRMALGIQVLRRRRRSSFD